MKTYKFALSNENIGSYVKELRALCENNNAERRMMLATCLSVEEILLNFQARFSAEENVRLVVKKRFGDLNISIIHQGESYNPLEENGEGNRFILDAIDLIPRYSYFNGANFLSVSLKCNKSKSDIMRILLSVALGLSVGFAGRFLPENILTPCHTVITAISDAIFALLKMASLPVIFLCVIYGIIGSGSISTFRENGLRLLGKFFFTMLIMLLLATGLCFVLFNIRLTASAADIPLAETLVNTLFSVLPDNIITPFANGDNVKVIVLGVIFGSALLALDNKVFLVNQLTGQLKDACSVVMGWVGKLIPLLIAVVLTDNIWSGDLGRDTLLLWKLVVLYFAVVIPVLLAMLLSVSLKRRIPYMAVAKAVLTPGLKGFASASSMLCYYDMVEGLTGKLKIPESRVNFGIPLSVAFYQPIITLYAVFVLFFVGKSGMSIDAGWVLSFMLVTFVTSVAAPPVSGGSVSLLAILFTTLGVSDPAIVMAYPLFMLLDYPNTGFRVMSMMLQVASGSKKAE